MKKTFSLTQKKKIKAARVAESVRCEINRYLKRQRRRPLPEGMDFWDFDCKYGPTEDEAKVVHVTELSASVIAAEAAGLESCYIEILGKAVKRTKKPQ
jgi:hypothetical protein